MKRTFILVNIVGVVFVLNACKQSTNKNSQNKGDNQSSLLWRITGNGLTTESYLYGTIHIQDQRVFEYGKVVKNAIESAEIIAIEVELDKIAYQDILEATLMKDSVLSQLLNSEDYAVLESKYQEITGITLRTAQRVKPFFLSASIIQAVVKNDTKVPLDMHFIQLGRENNKRVIGLESFTEQIDMIDKLSYSEQAKMLLESLTDTVDIVSVFNNLLDAYLTMDGDKLIELMSDPSIPKDFMHEILVVRNHLMTNRIIPLLTEGKLFVAVGAAHLFGNEGIVKLLQDKGFTVEAIPFSFGQ